MPPVTTWRVAMGRGEPFTTRDARVAMRSDQTDVAGSICWQQCRSPRREKGGISGISFDVRGRTSRLRDCVFDSRSKIPRSGDFSRILESTLGPVLRLISDLELTLGRRLRQPAALVPAEPSLLT
eukprot:COSAG06_NODE_2579_length_6621_cov_272.128948_3_plen_125_part_00